MSTQTGPRTSGLTYDGSAPVVLPLGEVAHNTTAQNGVYQTVPFDCYVAEAIISPRTAGTSAAAAAQVGTSAAPTSLFTKNIQNVSTPITLTADSEFTSAAARKLSKGDIINLNTAAASAVGQVAVSLVLIPRQA